MVACPVHERSLLSICPKCGVRLTWFRPGLLECKCGARFHRTERHLISVPEASLLDLIMRNVLKHPPREENPAALPQEPLLAMRLRSLLAVVRTLGKHRMIADGDPVDLRRERVVWVSYRCRHRERAALSRSSW
jgi:hypothetical protein